MRTAAANANMLITTICAFLKLIEAQANLSLLAADVKGVLELLVFARVPE